MSKSIKLNLILKYLNIKNNLKKKIIIRNISDLASAKKNDLVFFSNIKYLEKLKKTKASICLIKGTHIDFLPTNCLPIISKNPELDFIKITNYIYKNINLDFATNNILKSKDIKKKFKNIKYGQNFICGKNVSIGRNCIFGHNVIIDRSFIGSNTTVGNNVVIMNSDIGNNVNICDSSIIGKKGFGFKTIEEKIVKIPHIGKVIIKDNCDIGSNCNIDRGSIRDTIIGNNTFIDNQVQIAHNVNIGDCCIIASQSGIAGSTIIGNNTIIGGQVGISGHLKIGNNVKIGGKSGVIRNIGDGKVVMGYPAIEFREFIKKNQK